MSAATADPTTSLRSRIGDLASRCVPIVRWLPQYQRADLVPDAIASLTSWAVMVPVALAYASLAGVPPEIGLVTAFGALAAYAVFGTSRQLKVTTSSTMAVMSFALVTPLAGGDASRFIALSAALAFMVGAILVIAGLLRLGFISEFLAKPVVTGFIIGVAITIIVGQLSKILGVPGTSGSVPDQLIALAGEIGQTDPLTLALGLGSMLLMVILRRLAPRLPGGLIAVAVGIILVDALGLDDSGVAVVGPVQTGWPGIGLPDVVLSDLTYLLTGALGLVFLVVGESVSAARALALRHRQEIEPDQELVALGASNTVAGLFGGFAVDASLSQSAASDEAGARTQLASLLTSGLVLLTLLFLAPLFESLPMATLGAVVIVSAAGLIDLGDLRRYWRERRTDALLASAALIGVVTTDVLTGLIIAVLLSLLLVLYRASRRTSPSSDRGSRTRAHRRRCPGPWRRRDGPRPRRPASAPARSRAAPAHRGHRDRPAPGP
jgi:MFS superfamily sulfate permease-like transporter